MKSLFYCYSVPLKSYLLNKGFRYLTVALHPKSKDKFWLFEKGDNFNDVLAEWSKSNPNNK